METSFLRFVVSPLFELLGEIAPALRTDTARALDANLRAWEAAAGAPDGGGLARVDSG